MSLRKYSKYVLRFIVWAAVLGIFLKGPTSGGAGREILYVTNSGGNDVTVVDVATNTPIGSIETGATPHGLVASQDGRRIYVTGETDDDVVAIDTATSKVLWKAAVGEQPHELALTADGRHIYVPIRSSNYADVVDTETQRRIKSIPVGASPHNSYLSPDGKWIYVTSMGENKITIIDPTTFEVVGEIPVEGVPRPVAFTRDNKLAYLALTGFHGFVVVDIEKRKVIKKYEFPMTEMAEYSTYGYTPTHGLGFRPDEKQFWFTDVFGNAVQVVSLPEHKLLARLEVGFAPNWMTFTRDGRFLYVSNPGSDAVSVIDTEELREVTRIPVGRAPKRLLVVNVPHGMSGAHEEGWKTAASRPSNNDSYIKGGGILTAETDSFRDKFARGELTVESAAALYRELGLRGMSINAQHIQSWSGQSLSGIRKAIEDQDRILTALLVDGNLISDDEALNREQIEKTRRLIKATHLLGAPVVCIGLGSTGRGEAADRSVGIERAIAALNQLVPTARELGIKIAIENQPGPADTAEGMLQIIKETDAEWVGACLDLGYWKDTESIAKLAPFAQHVQVKAWEFDKFGDETSFNWDAALAPLEASGYGAALSIEYAGTGDPVRGVIKGRDLLIKRWVGRANTD